MKRYLPVLFLSLLLASCFKYIKIDNSLKYTVSGFHDVTIDQNDSCLFYLGVQLSSGDPTNEYITFSVSGLPDSVSVNHDTITFRPNYGFALVFYAHGPKPGVYPVTLKMVSPSMGTKMYTFNLTVTSLFDCTPQFSHSQVSSYDGRYDVQISGGYTSNVYGYVSRIGCDTLHIKVIRDSMEPGSEPLGMPYTVAEFSATVNCSANLLNIFRQSANGFQQTNETISGTGTFVPVSATSATTTINDTIYSGSQVVGTNTFTIY